MCVCVHMHLTSHLRDLLLDRPHVSLSVSEKPLEMRTYVCMYEMRTYVCMHVCVHVCMYVCMHVCISEKPLEMRTVAAPQLYLDLRPQRQDRLPEELHAA